MNNSTNSEGTRLTLEYEGIPLSLAVLLIVVSGAVAAWSYSKWAATLPRRHRLVLISIRILSLITFFLLLTQPVIRMSRDVRVRQSLLVLLDASKSMAMTDARVLPDDAKRAAIGTGALDPEQGLEQPDSAGQDLRRISRLELLEAIRENPKLRLWDRLADKSDLFVYRFGRQASRIGTFEKSAEENVAPSEVAKLDECTAEQSAIGDALRQILDENRGQSLAGVFLVSDGANNSGLPPLEAANLARADGLPIYAYGIGVSKPRDVTAVNIDGPRIGFVNERIEVTFLMEVGNLEGRKIDVRLFANGKEVDRSAPTLDTSETQKVTLGFVPDRAGEFELSAKAAPLDDEANKENNEATARIRIVDDKIRVLYIEQEPRWDFRYLLATLQRDRRLSVSAFLFDGDPGLAQLPDSPFLGELPATKEKLFGYQIIILGDVDPAALGLNRMELIKQWIGEVGGGIIFLAGPKFNPIAYRKTPLEPLFPVTLPADIAMEQYQRRYPELRPIRLTAAGEASQYFRAAVDPEQNQKIWENFPGVRWSAQVGAPTPGAEVIAVNPDPARAGSGGLMPVIAMQNYGAGQTIYFGTDETYRWRSRAGEVHYMAIWGQVMQGLSLHRLTGASQLVQLRSDMPRYFVGDDVTISGRIYQKNFEPLAAASVPGNLELLRKEEGKRPEMVESRDMAIAGKAGVAGEFSVNFKPEKPGFYRYTTIHDPKAPIEFEVVEPSIEMNDISMNAQLLGAMASVTNGKFLREEDLFSFPDLLEERSATVPRYDIWRLYLSAWWLLGLIVLMSCEWTLRRLWQLK